MVRHREAAEVVYVDRGGDASVKYLLWGAVIGAGLALLYAPTTGEETRRSLQRRLRKLRAMTEEKLDDLVQQFGSRSPIPREFEEDEELEDEIAAGRTTPSGPTSSAREELERRLEQARARRRSASADSEGPVA